MTPAIEIRKRAIELIEQLSPERLTVVVQLLEFLSDSSQQLALNPEEVALVEVIQQQHLTQAEQRCLEELRDRCEWGKLTDVEHEELIQYEDQLEQWRVERLQALMELTKRKNIDLLTKSVSFTYS